ncbi:MAG TPA: N-acetylmuramoyl-L-alanine amidase, partial [Prevotella sp.]
TVPAPNNSHAPEQTAQEKAATGSEPLFKVQILVCKRKLRPDDSHLKGLTNVDYYEENNLLKYTYGASNNYNEIVALRKQILESFPQAFIIAFKDGKRVDVNQAIKEYKTNKKK